MTIRVLLLQLKDKAAAFLAQQAREVNLVCNYSKVKKNAPAKPVHPPADVPSGDVPSIGTDLGLKDLAAANDGTKPEAKWFDHNLESALSVAQLAGMKGRTRSIHAKIDNR